MTLGSLSIYLAALFGGISLVTAVLWARGDERAAKPFAWSYHAMTILLGVASILLMVAILTHDFRFHYVIGYSSRDLPLIYLISAFWGGQQGTFLLWALLGALIGYPLFRKTAWEPAAVMSFYVPTVMYMVVLMLFNDGNPFATIAQVPPDGRGLNPLLQDPWMASHPPAVFLGYAAMTVPAALALAALAKREESRWFDTGLRWGLLGWLSLGTGIILGGFWAYKVLGWGGYWGWDPVENASLVPWIIVTGLIHGLLVQKFTGALRRTNLILALAGYLTVLYATFLTRSGILADFSVHSFPKSPLLKVLAAIMLITLLASVFLLVRRRTETEGKPIAVNVGWPFLLSLAIGLFTISAIVVAVGMSMPIISGLFTNPFVPEISFYNIASLPIYVLALAVLCIAPFSAWRKEKFSDLGTTWLIAAALGAVLTTVAMMMGGHGFRFLLLFFVASFALFSNLIRFSQVARVSLLHSGAAIAHIGFSLMFIGIVASSAWDREAEVYLPIGEPVDSLDYIMTYRGHVDGSEPKDRWRVAVMEPGGAETTALVKMFQVNMGGEQQLMRHPAILRHLGYDLYIAPLGLEQGEHTAVLAEQRPFEHGNERLVFAGFHMDNAEDGAHMMVSALVNVEVNGEFKEQIKLSLQSRDGELVSVPVTVESLGGAVVAMQRMSVEERAIQISFRDAGATETLVVNVAVKPLMNVLWAGTILMLVGCGVAVIRRYIEKRALEAMQRAA